MVRLVRRANHDLRRAILMIADNLIKCNEHFGVLAAGWRLKKLDPRDIRVRVAGRFCRIAYHMVAGRMTYRHPCSQQRDYILTKLIRFALEHEIAPDQLLRNLDAATVQLPPRTIEKKRHRWRRNWLGSRPSGDLDPRPSAKSSPRSWPNWG